MATTEGAQRGAGHEEKDGPVPGDLRGRPRAPWPASPPASPRQWLHRVGWLVAIWASSVAALAGAAALLRLLMQAMGWSA